MTFPVVVVQHRKRMEAEELKKKKEHELRKQMNAKKAKEEAERLHKVGDFIQRLHNVSDVIKRLYKLSVIDVLHGRGG